MCMCMRVRVCAATIVSYMSHVNNYNNLSKHTYKIHTQTLPCIL